MLAMGFPRIYRQGVGVFDEMGSLIAEFGQKPLIVADDFVRQTFSERLEASLKAGSVDATFAPFDGECSAGAIDKAVEVARKAGCDVVVGIGGGKVLDAAKGVSIDLQKPVIIVPTIASNDSPTSRLAILYEEDGSFVGPRFMKTNPDAVLVDTGIVAKAPVRFLIAGIGDALVTKFEADQCAASGADNFFGGKSTQAAVCLSDLCYSLVRAHARDAVREAKEGKASDALEKVIEANVLLSGLGFEGCGVAAAHGVGLSFSMIPEMHGTLHGEEVAVGLLCQFVMEDRPEAFMRDILAFYAEVGLPSTLEELGLEKVKEEHLDIIAAAATKPKSRIHNMTMPVSADMVKEALKKANKMANDFKAMR